MHTHSAPKVNRPACTHVHALTLLAPFVLGQKKLISRMTIKIVLAARERGRERGRERERERERGKKREQKREGRREGF